MTHQKSVHTTFLCSRARYTKSVKRPESGGQGVVATHEDARGLGAHGFDKNDRRPTRRSNSGLMRQTPNNMILSLETTQFFSRNGSSRTGSSHPSCHENTFCFLRPGVRGLRPLQNIPAENYHGRPSYSPIPSRAWKSSRTTFVLTLELLERLSIPLQKLQVAHEPNVTSSTSRPLP